MKKIIFLDTDALCEAVNDNYFNGSYGKLKDRPKPFRFEDGSVMNKVLEDGDEVKISNSSLEGTLKCSVSIVGDIVELTPVNRYCIKEENLFSFY